MFIDVGSVVFPPCDAGNPPRKSGGKTERRKTANSKCFPSIRTTECLLPKANIVVGRIEFKRRVCVCAQCDQSYTRYNDELNLWRCEWQTGGGMRERHTHTRAYRHAHRCRLEADEHGAGRFHIQMPFIFGTQFVPACLRVPRSGMTQQLMMDAHRGGVTKIRDGEYV